MVHGESLVITTFIGSSGKDAIQMWMQRCWELQARASDDGFSGFVVPVGAPIDSIERLQDNDWPEFLRKIGQYRFEKWKALWAPLHDRNGKVGYRLGVGPGECRRLLDEGSSAPLLPQGAKAIFDSLLLRRFQVWSPIQAVSPDR